MTQQQKKNESLQKKIKCFEEIGGLCKMKIMPQNWGRHDLENPKEALSLFLERYAFGRNIRSPYPKFVRPVLDKVDNLSAPEAPQEIWDKFLKELEDKKYGSNKYRNPLFHVEEEDDCNCVICVLRKRLKREQEAVPNIVMETQKLLREGEVGRVYEIIKSIRGIGPKITPSFLRDVTIWFDVEVEEYARYLLQPVDIWVKRTVEVLSPEGKKGDEDKARWICEESRKSNANPERVNKGVWFFGAEIVDKKSKLGEALKNICDKARSYFDTLSHS